MSLVFSTLSLTRNTKAWWQSQCHFMDKSGPVWIYSMYHNTYQNLLDGSPQGLFSLIDFQRSSNGCSSHFLWTTDSRVISCITHTTVIDVFKSIALQLYSCYCYHLRTAALFHCRKTNPPSAMSIYGRKAQKSSLTANITCMPDLSWEKSFEKVDERITFFHGLRLWRSRKIECVRLWIYAFLLTLRSTSFPSKSYRDAPFDVTSDASCRATLRSEILSKETVGLNLQQRTHTHFWHSYWFNPYKIYIHYV